MYFLPPREPSQCGWRDEQCPRGLDRDFGMTEGKKQTTIHTYTQIDPPTKKKNPLKGTRKETKHLQNAGTKITKQAVQPFSKTWRVDRPQTLALCLYSVQNGINDKGTLRSWKKHPPHHPITAALEVPLLQLCQHFRIHPQNYLQA